MIRKRVAQVYKPHTALGLICVLVGIGMYLAVREFSGWKDGSTRERWPLLFTDLCYVAAMIIGIAGSFWVWDGFQIHRDIRRRSRGRSL